MIKILCIDNDYDNAVKDNLTKHYYVAVEKILYISVPDNDTSIRGCEIKLVTGEILICVEKKDNVFEKLMLVWSKK